MEESSGSQQDSTNVSPQTHSFLVCSLVVVNVCVVMCVLCSDACDLTLDPNTANYYLILSEENRKVTYVKEPQSYPDHPDRFDGDNPQVLCSESLTGRCYWETEWSGNDPEISVAYKGIKRKGVSWSYDCVFGYNENSWSLICSDQRFTIRHNNKEADISAAPGSCKRSVSGRVERLSVLLQHL